MMHIQNQKSKECSQNTEHHIFSSVFLHFSWISLYINMKMNLYSNAVGYGLYLKLIGFPHSDLSEYIYWKLFKKAVLEWV